jgi:hypothetical protein
MHAMCLISLQPELRIQLLQWAAATDVHILTCSDGGKEAAAYATCKWVVHALAEARRHGCINSIAALLQQACQEVTLLGSDTCCSHSWNF